MRLPRDISGTDLIKMLRVFGYEVSRQNGSHIRLTTEENGQHHITVPAHNPLKIGTLSAILGDVASHFDITKEEVLERIL